MATWDELRSYIRINYKVDQDDGNLIRLLFAIGDDRTQIVIVAKSSTGDGASQFATIASPFAEVGDIDIESALTAIAEYVVGGVVAYGRTYMVRHSVPLETLDPGEFEGPLRMVLHTADALEAKLIGSDKF
ncbi:hypothetical protein OHB24_06760 [Kribbella sp. NBC_00482]|uniref:hypothetical protein n=1 Tax=Kribbella sp. NBC_00482 TaxID=2975968 RepID=UPI002E1753C4